MKLLTLHINSWGTWLLGDSRLGDRLITIVILKVKAGLLK